MNPRSRPFILPVRGCLFVTVDIDRVVFHHSVRQGTILAIQCERVKQGTTSVTYAVEVRDSKAHPAPIFSTTQKTDRRELDSSQRSHPRH